MPRVRPDDVVMEGIFLLAMEPGPVDAIWVLIFLLQEDEFGEVLTLAVGSHTNRRRAQRFPAGKISWCNMRIWGVDIKISIRWTGNGRVQDVNGILLFITDNKLANRGARRMEGSRIPASPRCPHHYSEVLSASGLECATRG